MNEHHCVDVAHIFRGGVKNRITFVSASSTAHFLTSDIHIYIYITHNISSFSPFTYLLDITPALTSPVYFTISNIPARAIIHSTMPGYKAIGQVGLGGFLYVTAAKLISKLSQYGESGAPVPERPARYAPAVLSTLSSYSSPETLLPIPNIAQNVTATITMSSLSSTDASTISPLWTMILSLWSLIQVMAQFLTEQCGEFIAELTVQLLLLVTIAFLGNHIDEVLRRILGHPESPTADECVNQEAPANSTTMRITKATIHLLHELADRIQHRINNLEAKIANIIVEGGQAINNLCTELGHAKKTITGLERKLKETIDDRDRQLEEANTKSQSSIQKVQNLEAELEEIYIKYNDAVEDSQTTLEEAEKGRNKVESELSEASDKIAALETNLECMVHDRDKAASDRHTEAEIARKRIAQLEVQCKHWRNKLDESEATITQKIDKAVTTAKNNAEKVKARLLEVAKVGHDSEISKLKAELIAAKDPSASDLAALKADLAKKEEMEKKLIAEKDQSASEVAGLREALAEKEEREKALIAAKNQSASEVAALKETLAKKEDEESTPSFNPAAKEFTPHRGASSDSTLTSTPYTSLPATPLSPSPSPLPTIPYQHTSLPTTPFAPSPSPFPPAPYQQTPVKKQELRGEPRRVVDGINNKFAERSRRKMMGMPAEDEETKPLSKEELGKHK